MLDTDHQAVWDSYYRCEASGKFFDTFYRLFFSKSPEIPPKFARTDMEHQKQVAMASVLTLLQLGAQNDVDARLRVEELGESHSRRCLDISPDLYDKWLDALCDSVRQHDPQCTSELIVAWKRAMRPGIDLMISMY